MEKRELTQEEERLERHIRAQTSIITVEAHQQAVLSIKRRCFPSFGVFRHDLRERLSPIRKKAVMTQGMLSPSDKAQTRKRANKDAYAINDRDFSP
ncbi:MAG: hypothetical protein IJG85_03780 [Eubacteriaceae bacterium]|nr:hypothetical protein [Eubacteriaceae bacterium]